MAVRQQWAFTCDITGLDLVADSNDMPPGWARLNGLVVSPRGYLIVAHRVVNNPTADQDVLMAPATDAERAEVGLPPLGQ